MNRLHAGLMVLCLMFLAVQPLAAQPRGKGPRFGQAGPGVSAPGRGAGGPAANAVAGSSAAGLSAQSLTQMWEEEKLARDVYLKLSGTSQLPMFQNIVQAEGQHMQALERLLAANGVAVSTLNSTPGAFSTAEYQQLYTTLVATGSASPLAAVKVGAKIEEMDIADLQRLLATTANPQQRQVLEHLQRGSRNHLRAFAGQIAQQGESYQAEFLSQAEFDQIAQSTPETGPPSSAGGGRQGGPGRAAHGRPWYHQGGERDVRGGSGQLPQSKQAAVATNSRATKSVCRPLSARAGDTRPAAFGGTC